MYHWLSNLWHIASTRRTQRQWRSLTHRPTSTHSVEGVHGCIPALRCQECHHMPFSCDSMIFDWNLFSPLSRRMIKINKISLHKSAYLNNRLTTYFNHSFWSTLNSPTLPPQLVCCCIHDHSPPLLASSHNRILVLHVAPQFGPAPTSSAL